MVPVQTRWRSRKPRPRDRSKSAGANEPFRDLAWGLAHRGVALLRARDRIDPRRVFVLGHSLGGTLALRIAADDRSLAGLIIMTGATRPLLDVAREQVAYLAPPFLRSKGVVRSVLSASSALRLLRPQAARNGAISKSAGGLNVSRMWCS